MTYFIRHRSAVLMALIFAVAAALRVVYPAADPPWRSTVGVVWHDEGAWVHNARNKALFGAWTLDEWNPVFIAPVFTGLEYLSFEVFGVGVRQARLVSELAGFRVGASARVGRRAGSAGRAAAIVGGGAARDQLRLRDVRPGRDHGSVDGRLHRRELVLLRARRTAASVGLGSQASLRAARVFHQGVGGILLAALGVAALMDLVRRSAGDRDRGRRAEPAA